MSKIKVNSDVMCFGKDTTKNSKNIMFEDGRKVAKTLEQNALKQMNNSKIGIRF